MSQSQQCADARSSGPTVTEVEGYDLTFRVGLAVAVLVSIAAGLIRAVA
jgi:hypothetical protein